MTLLKEETARKPIYSIPGLIEMDKEFDDIMVTGSYSAQTYLQPSKLVSTRVSTTDYEKDDFIDLLNLYLFSLSPTLEFSQDLVRYVSIKSTSQNTLTQLARNDLSKLENKRIKNQATLILNIIENQLKGYAHTTLPPIRVADLDDGSIIIEWIFENFRMGFNLDSDPEKSGYFLVSKETVGGIRSSGYLRGLKIESIVQSLMTIVLSNLIANE